MRVVIGADHAGYALKQELAKRLGEWGHEVEDVGTHGLESVDYPSFAVAVGERVRDAGGAALGVLVCGTGVGVSIAANKLPGVRAARCDDPFTSAMSRAHNDANVLCLGSRVIGAGVAEATLRAFVDGPFEGGRHQRRVDQLAALDAAPKS